MSMGPPAWPVPEPGYVTAPICASGEARTAIASHSSPESWLMAWLAPRFDDHRVAGPGGLRPAINGDGALAGGDQQDLFDLVGVFRDRLVAGKDVDEHGHRIRAAGPVDQALQRRQPGPAHKNRTVVAAHD